MAEAHTLQGKHVRVYLDLYQSERLVSPQYRPQNVVTLIGRERYSCSQDVEQCGGFADLSPAISVYYSCFVFQKTALYVPWSFFFS